MVEVIVKEKKRSRRSGIVDVGQQGTSLRDDAEVGLRCWGAQVLYLDYVRIHFGNCPLLLLSTCFTLNEDFDWN